MDRYRDETYGERIADVYDDWFGEYDAGSIGVLKEFARGGRALELGIGTGRIALPLQAAGVVVEGIDASEAMVGRLRSKPGGDRIPVTVGDFGDVGVEGRFPLVFVVGNTFFALLTQEDQVRCFQNVALHLDPEGVFVVEAFVPDLTRFDRGQTVRAFRAGIDEVHLEATLLDTSTQLISAQQVSLTEGGIRFYPVKLRYAWPSELDLMARIAGLRLVHRWADWQKSGFTADSDKHISVYGHAA
jgi:SAM-dependent methyltransferase